MPKIGNSKSSSEILCERCNSKRKVSKSWTEKIKNDYGFMTLEHSQIICTNNICQAEFEVNMNKEIELREKLKQGRIDNALKRSSENAKPAKAA